MADSSNTTSGLGCLGSFVAALLSWFKWHSVGWLIFHLFCGWFYVAYYVVRYGLR